MPHAAKAAYDAAYYYEQLALALEAENLAFYMAKACPSGMPDEKAFALGMPGGSTPQAPPGLDSIAPPPGLEHFTMGSSSQELVKNDTEKTPRQICWFQNRYLHAKPEDNVAPCSKGDDCEFCHSFHPKISRRDGKKGRCFCASYSRMQCQQQHSAASDTASTGTDDACTLEPHSSDESTQLPDLAESPPVFRQVCYFQNRWHNSEEGENFQPCIRGNDCLHCHEVHPKIKRRSGKTSLCSCPGRH